MSSDNTIAYIFMGATSAIFSGVSVWQFKQFNKNKSKLEEIERTETFSPKNLLQAITENDNRYVQNQFKKNELNQNQIVGKIFLDGVVKCPKGALDGLIDKETKLVLSQYFNQPIYSNDNLETDTIFKEEKKYDSQSKRQTKFFDLEDYESNQSARIEFDHACDASGALQLVSQRQNDRKLNFIEKFFVGVGLVIKVLYRLAGKTSPIRGIKIGMKEREFGIKIDSVISIYGDLIYDFKQKIMKIEVPEFIVQDKHALVARFKKTVSQNRNACLISGLIAIGLGSFAGYKLLTKKKRSEN